MKLPKFFSNPKLRDSCRRCMHSWMENLCHIIIFCLCIVHITGQGERNYIQDIAPDFYQACPCIEPMEGVDPLLETKTSTLAECWGLCFLEVTCFSFSYSDITSLCAIYSQNSIVYKMDSNNAARCLKPGGRVWGTQHYLFSSQRKGETYSCSGLASGGHNSDGYYDVKIRGHIVSVYCILSQTQPITYLDMYGFSRWGGGSHYLDPQTPVDLVWSKARIYFDECIAVLHRTDDRFAVYQQSVPSSGIVGDAIKAWRLFGGGDCSNQAVHTTDYGGGEAIVRTNPSVFTLAPNIGSRWDGYNAVRNSYVITSDFDEVSSSGIGFCGHGLPVDNVTGAEMDYFPIFWSFR